MDGIGFVVDEIDYVGGGLGEEHACFAGPGVVERLEISERVSCFEDGDVACAGIENGKFVADACGSVDFAILSRLYYAGECYSALDIGWQDGVAQDGKLVGDIEFPQLASGDVDLDDLVGCECIGLGLGVRRRCSSTASMDVSRETYVYSAIEARRDVAR